MNRRLFLGSIIGLALQSAVAKAQSQPQPRAIFDPHPAFVHVEMIVVDHVSIVSDDQSLLAQLDDKSLGAEVTEFIASRLDAAGHPLTVDQRQVRALPQGVTEADVFHVAFRFDLSLTRVGGGPAVLVGTVSTYYRRGEFGLLSWAPMTHFVLEGDRSLTERARQALLEQAQKSVVDVIVDLKKHGF